MQENKGIIMSRKLTAGQKKIRQFCLDIQNIYDMEPDRWGNYKFEKDGRLYRIKMQKTTIRLEIKLTRGWVKVMTTSPKAGYAPYTPYLLGHVKV